MILSRSLGTGQIMLLGCISLFLWQETACAQPGAEARAKAAEEVSKLMQKADYISLEATVYRWKAELPVPIQKAIIATLLKQVVSSEDAPLMPKEKTAGRHILSSKAGRAAWALGKILATSVPPFDSEIHVSRRDHQEEVTDKIIMGLQLRHEPHLGLVNATGPERIKIAQDRKATTVVLDRLAYDENIEVRLAVADNPRTTLHQLANLLADPVESVRDTAMKNLRRPRTQSGDVVDLEKK